MVKGLWNYAIKVNDIQKAADFYTQYMGAELRFSSVIFGCRSILLRIGESRIILFERAPYEKDLGLNLPLGFLHVVYEVDHFESAVDRVRLAGVEFIMEPCVIKGEFGVRKIAFFETPDGIRTEIMQVLEDSGKT